MDILHFGNTAMSRADRAHLVIKDAIRSSVGDLDKVLYHISAILRRQKEEYQAELARQAASRAAKKLLSPMFRLVAEWVSHHALFKTDEIVQKLRRLQTEHREKRKGGNIPFTLDPCTKGCSASKGACIHEIHERLGYATSRPRQKSADICKQIHVTKNIFTTSS
jgi:hypothetical protein